MNMLENYLERAELVARIVDAVLTSRPGTDPALIERWVLTRTESGSVWLFAVLNDRQLPKFEPYQAAVHHLSSSLRGMPVVMGNHTGLRYGFLLSRKPQLPVKVDYPGWKKGVMQLGIDARGQAVEIAYAEISHALVAGITQFGKSNLLRLMAIQAREDGWKLALADPEGRTFSGFKGDEALLFPIGGKLDGCERIISQVMELVEMRSNLFERATNHPDSLDEYNEWAMANGEAALPPVLVMLDEFNGVVMATGGVKGRFAQAATQVAWRAAKFGVRMVLSGQDFSKEIVGPVRDQMTTRICLRVANARVSDVVLGRTGAERLNTQGRALTNRWGAIQIYYVPKQSMERADANGLTPDEQMVAANLWKKYDGRMTMTALQELGITERQARRMRADWSMRGLAKIDPNQDNALCLTVKMPVQAGSDGSDAVRTGLDGLAGLDMTGAVEA